MKMMGYNIPENSPLYKQLKDQQEIDIVKACLEDTTVNAVRENFKLSQER